MGIVGQVLLIVTGVLTARLLGPEGRGELALLIVLPTVISIIGSLGIQQAFVVLVSGGSWGASANRVLSAFAGLVMAQSVILGLVYFLGLYLFRRGHPEISWTVHVLSSIVLITTGLGGFLATVLQASGRFGYLNALRVAPLGVYAAGICGLWAASISNVKLTLLFWVASHAAIFGLIGYLNRMLLCRIQWSLKACRNDVSRLLRSGLSGHLGSLSALDVLQIDKLFIGVVMSPAALGLFIVAQSFANLPRILVANANQVLMPSLASGALNPHVFFRAAFVKGGVIALFSGFVLILFQPYLISLLFGDEFKSSIVAAQFLLAAGILGSLKRLCTDAMWAFGKPGVGTISEGILLGIFGIGCAASMVWPSIELLALSILVAQSVALLYALGRWTGTLGRSRHAEISSEPSAGANPKGFKW